MLNKTNLIGLVLHTQYFERFISNIETLLFTKHIFKASIWGFASFASHNVMLKEDIHEEGERLILKDQVYMHLLIYQNEVFRFQFEMFASLASQVVMIKNASLKEDERFISQN